MNLTLTTGSPSIDVIEAIAEAEGTDPMELDFVLREYIDPDALDALSSGSESSWQATFHVDDHEVTVDSEGVITVDGTRYR